jgi:hypothetical protein
MRVSDDPSAYPELRRLLAAATAPPRPAELAGRAAAVAAFEEAGAVPVAPVRRRSGRRVAVKVVAAAALVLFGGSAVVAEAGRLPGGGQRHAYEAFSGLGVPPPSPRPPVVRATPSPAGAAAPGLCRAWRKKPEKKVPRALVALAGGLEHVAAYCDRVSPVERSRPARPGKAKDKSRKKPHPKDRPA